MATGVCKLTGTQGRFVKSHLIPKALTKPEVNGMPFVERGRGQRPLRRWSSWYDDQLVTRAGEDILAKLDDWAVATLRKEHLVWSGWGPMQRLIVPDMDTFPGTSLGIRRVSIDPTMLRLFFISLLWRAAASARPEFKDITVPDQHLEQLRMMVMNGTPEPLSFYPTMLTQLSTLGMIHNLTPIATKKVIPAHSGTPETVVPTFRFYFDGLIAHVHRQATDDGLSRELGPLVVGGESTLVLNTVTYEHSFQRSNLELIVADTLFLWPDARRKLPTD
jgi:hypothetical protein